MRKRLSVAAGALALFALAAVTLLTPAGPNVLGQDSEETSTPTVEPPQEFAPWEDGTIRPGVEVERETPGSCLLGSLVLDRSDAWRCFDDEDLALDPCVEHPEGEDRLACFETQSSVTLLELDEPLPRTFANPEPGTGIQSDGGIPGTTSRLGAPAGEDPTGALYDVTSTREDGLQRITWDFGDGDMPSYSIAYTSDEPTEPGSGRPVDVEGETWLRVNVFPARRVLFQPDGDNVETYLRPLRIPATDNPNLHEAVFIGDFEAEMDWYLGMEDIGSFDVEVESDPARLVLTLYDPVEGISQRPVLGVGSTGQPVRALQEQLYVFGYLGQDTTPGEFDQAVREAVVAFQEDEGLVPNGEVGPDTWAALESVQVLEDPDTWTIPGLASDGQPPTPTPAPTSTPTPTATVTPTPTATPSPSPTPSPTRPGEAGYVYLTFDDGPDPSWTPAVLDVLDRHNARATFFVLGQAVTRYPGIAEREVDSGHTIGNHTFNHARLTTIGADAMFAELRETTQAIEDATGHRTDCLRPPYGATNATVRERADDAGYRMVRWDIDPQDWRSPGANVIANHVIANARPGAVILLHDGGGNRSQTVEALDTILAELGSRGYGFRTLNC
ncbi:MAG: polysaccharide deacetylase family protein [Dehalococcoidia bacterium]|nr:polysaccharide deacetylase family protein [Dehalococcoidia bacterium]